MTCKIKSSILNYSGTKQWGGGLVPHTCGTHTFIKVQVWRWKGLSANQPKAAFLQTKARLTWTGPKQRRRHASLQGGQLLETSTLPPGQFGGAGGRGWAAVRGVAVVPTFPPPTSSSNSTGWLTPPTVIWFRVPAGSDQSSFINRSLILKI